MQILGSYGLERIESLFKDGFILTGKGVWGSRGVDERAAHESCSWQICRVCNRF